MPRTPDTAAGDDIERMLDRMFLSPRIVDQAALETFAGSLKSLIRDAATQQRALDLASTEVKALGGQLREASRELGERVERAARVVPTIDQRVAAIESLLKQPGPRAEPPDPATMDTLARAAIERVLVARASEMEALESRAAGTLRRAEETLAQLDGAARALEGLADGIVVRVAALAQQVEAARSELDGAARGAEARVTELNDRVTQLLASADTEVTRASTTLGAAVTEAERRGQTLVTGIEAGMLDLDRRAAQAREEREGRDAATLAAAAEAERALLGAISAALEQRVTLEDRLRNAEARVRDVADTAARLATMDESLTRARTVGDSLAKLVAHADMVGSGLATLLDRAQRPGQG
ncbi:MAG: hypothetical protein DYG92_03880 [Leptolyngbya sp. PLA1]|nr:hypothetical protein [Leptolyngbya sp. PLA1]